MHKERNQKVSSCLDTHGERLAPQESSMGSTAHGSVLSEELRITIERYVNIMWLSLKEKKRDGW